MDKRAGAIGPREARAPLEGARPFAVSQCLRCAGCRFVAGRHDQVYMRCERTAQRYPRQPQLRCEAFQGLERATLTLPLGVQRPFIWCLPPLTAPLTFTLGSPLELTSSPLNKPLSSAPLSPSLSPPSALLLDFLERDEETLERDGEPLSRGRLLWSSTPQRGLCLGWSDGLLALPLGSSITITPHLNAPSQDQPHPDGR